MARLIWWVMVKGPVYLGLGFLQGRRILMNLVDSQTFCPGWYVGVLDRLGSFDVALPTEADGELCPRPSRSPVTSSRLMEHPMDPQTMGTRLAGN